MTLPVRSWIPVAVCLSAFACTRSSRTPPEPGSPPPAAAATHAHVPSDEEHAGVDAGADAGARPEGHAGRKHPHGNDAQRFSDVERWSGVFEDPKRDAWQKPDEVIRALSLRPGMKVADIGAATGYFPVRIARTHPKVTVYGVDVAPAMVDYLKARAAREGLKNLHASEAAPSDPRLPEPVDLLLLVDTYHHLDKRTAYFEDVRRRYLRPGGRIAVVDFRMDATLGPSRDHKLPPDVVIRELEAAGFELAERHEFLPQQYFLVFEPKAS